MSCTRPLAYNADTTSSPIVVTLTDIFDLKELQQIQDSFAVATGVASIITQPDGVPITTPSNFTRLCNDIIRKTGKGCANCYKSDALLGRYNPEGPVLQPCLSGGLWDAGASITVGGHHVGNWLIGQVRNETQDEASMLSYADDIGADRKDFLAALAEVPSMSVDQFRNVANALFLLANQLSDKAYQNLQLKQTIKQREQAELELKASEQRFSELIRYSSDSITILDKNGIQIFVSDAVEKMLGYKPSELLGIPVIEEMLHPDDQEMVSHAFATIINDGMGGAQYRHKHKNGSWVYLEAWGTNQLENPDIRGVVVNVRDITERKQAETSLRESREKYRIMFENLPLGLAFTDTTGRYLEVNRAIEEIFGSSRRNLLGVPPLERGFTVLHQDGTPFQQHELITLRAAREQQLIQGDHLIRRTNGTYCYVSSIAAPLPLPGYGAMLAVMDITERKRAEDALRESESRLQNLFEKMPNGYYRSTPAGRFVDANPAFVKMLGYDSKEELLQVDIPRTVYVEPEERGVYLRANKNSEFLGFEHVEYYRLRGKDGRIIQVEDQARYVKNAQGEVAFHEGICRDITERKTAEEALQESELRFKALHNASFGGIAIHDKGVILECNQGLSVISGYTYEELIGMNGLLLIAEQSRTEVLNNIKSGYEKAYKVFGVRKTGEEYPVRLEAKNIPYKGKNVRVVEFRDITESRQVEEERERLINELEAKNAELERFTYTVSHDLKSPLITINGFVGILKRDIEQSNQEGASTAVARIEKAAIHMVELLDDLLEFSRIGRLENEYENIAMSDLAVEVEELLHGLLSASSASLEIQANMPVVYGDRLRLQEVVQNLVENAIKFVPQGTAPHIRVGYDADCGKGFFYVEDNGIGVCSQYHDRIFELFEQLNPTLGGTGIGLALVKRIVQHHGGSIWVEEAKQDGGARFCFSLLIREDSPAS